MPEPQESTPGQYAFDWQKLGFVKQFTREFLEDFQLPPGVGNVSLQTGQSAIDFMADTMFMQLKAYVLTHQLAEHSVSRTRTVEWPASPWQHWKHRHAGAWWLRWFVERRPVRMQQEVVDFQEAWTELASYPWQTLVPPLPQLGRPVRVVLSDTRWTPEDTQ